MDEVAIEKRVSEAYAEGRRRTLINLANHFAGELYTAREHPRETSFGERLLRLEADRLEMLGALRELCAELGCNDWPDNLHPHDVVEKHLGRRVRELVAAKTAK